MQSRDLEFVQNMLKSLKKLETEWFPPGLKSPEGYFYGCGYCDMECGGNEAHDLDCLPQMAKNVLLAIKIIEMDQSYDTDHKGNPRLPEEAFSMRAFFMKQLILKDFFAPILSHLIPLDYKDPANRSVICSCYMKDQFKTKQRRLKHHRHCIYQELAHHLSQLYQT